MTISVSFGQQQLSNGKRGPKKILLYTNNTAFGVFHYLTPKQASNLAEMLLARASEMAPPKRYRNKSP